MEPIVLTLPIANNSERRDVEVKKCTLTLYDTHVEYIVICDSEDFNDVKSMWELTHVDWEFVRCRKDIESINFYYDSEEGRYETGIVFYGKSIAWMFEKPEEARKVYKILKSYYLDSLKK